MSLSDWSSDVCSSDLGRRTMRSGPHAFTADAAAAAVKAWGPDRIVLLPLYPQHSTTTTQSSREAWRSEERRVGRERRVSIEGTRPDNTETRRVNTKLT